METGPYERKALLVLVVPCKPLTSHPNTPTSHFLALPFRGILTGRSFKNSCGEIEIVKTVAIDLDLHRPFLI
ncbi:hypothetical protein E2C01_011711 [Portunus trituberculatus]|uniref:Uncharacterized protein n=1 Tax=Portunus trituberculatus TaxID=210409 RepID=A0A5B7DCK0_PORTR|nr:hypothetical protein [Portunus trituberculatus]